MTVHTVDAVIVGAGHNGLVAANLLADAGWDVLVLEAADAPGGAVRSAPIVAPGYVADLCASFFPLGAASPVMSRMGLEKYGLRWCHAPYAVAHVLPDDRCAVISRDIDETAASVSAFDPADGDAWRAECARWAVVGNRMVDALFRSFPPVTSAAGLLAALGPAEALRFIRFALLPIRRHGQETFNGEGGKILLAGNALHTDLGPEGAGSAIFGWLLAMLAQHVGYPAAEGGAQAIVDALVGRLTARGGSVVCGRAVDRVLVARGRAVGVRIAGGELVRARRAVLADVPAPALYLDLVGERHLPWRLVDDLRKFQWDNTMLKVDWALSGPIPWTAKEARRAGTVHLGADLDGMSGYAADLSRRRMPEAPFVLSGQMTMTDPTRSPAGTETLWAYTHLPRDRHWTADDLRRHADRVQALFERHAPGFESLIVGRTVSGPAENTHGNPSLVEGTLNNGTAALHQQLVFRPVPGLGRPDTPIDRLYLAGSSAHPGGGVHGGPGGNAARAALTRDGMAGPAYAAAIRAAHRVVY